MLEYLASGKTKTRQDNDKEWHQNIEKIQIINKNGFYKVCVFDYEEKFCSVQITIFSILPFIQSIIAYIKLSSILYNVFFFMTIQNSREQGTFLFLPHLYSQHQEQNLTQSLRVINVR